MDLKSLTSDRKVQIAAAGGAVLGLVAFIRHKGSTGTEASAEQSFSGVPTTGGGGGYLGAYDSTATDVYNNLQTSLDNQLGEFRTQLGGLQGQLDKLTPSTPVNPGPPKTPTPTTPKPPGKPKPKPRPSSPPRGTTPGRPTPGKQLPPVTPRRPARKSITIPAGSTLSGLARQYGTSVSQLMALNPQIKNPNRIYAGAQLRVK